MKKIVLLVLLILSLESGTQVFAKSKIPWNINFIKNNTQSVIIPEVENAEKWHEEAIAFYNTNDIDNAYALLKKIPKNQLKDMDYLLMANIMQDKNKLDEAEIYLQKALEINPKFYKAYYNLGNIAAGYGKNDTAIKYYKKAIKYNKNFAYSYYNAGICYARKQEFKTAKSYFNRAILRKNNDADFYYNLAYVYKKLGNTKNAEKSLTIYNNLINR